MGEKRMLAVGGNRPVRLIELLRKNELLDRERIDLRDLRPPVRIWMSKDSLFYVSKVQDPG